MSQSNSFFTQVYRLPTNEQDRANFLEGVKALAEKFQVQVVAGSRNDEISFNEILEKELEGEVGFYRVEELRQVFESQNI